MGDLLPLLQGISGQQDAGVSIAAADLREGGTGSRPASRTSSRPGSRSGSICASPPAAALFSCPTTPLVAPPVLDEREWSISSIGGAALAAAAAADVDKSVNGEEAYDDEGQTPKTLRLPGCPEATDTTDC